MVKLLLVEGPTDSAVISKLLNVNKVNIKQLNERDDILKFDSENIRLLYIQYCGGVSNLYKKFKTYLAQPQHFDSIGLIIDNDPSDDRFKEFYNVIRDVFKKNVKPSKDGLIIDGDGNDPKIGLWLMPDNIQKGSIEDFLISWMKEAKQYPDSFEFIGDSASNARNQELVDFNEVRQNKVIVETYKIWVENRQKKLDELLERLYLQQKNETTEKFISWLKSLFELEQEPTP